MLQICVMVYTLHVYVGRSVMFRSPQYIRFSGLIYYLALFLVKTIFSIVKHTSTSEEPSILVNSCNLMKK